MPAIQIEGVTKRFRARPGREVVAIRDCSLGLAPGERLVLVGPSGSGKTTLLRLLAGLDTPDAGRVLVEGRPIAGIPAAERDLAFVFQDHPLFPHLTVAANLGLGLALRRAPPELRARRVAEAATLLGLEPLLDRLPATLSGGERQRVGLGMALVRRPALLLLDEPLAQLDAPLRAQLRSEIRRLHRELHPTTVYVTHDQADAMAMAAGGRLAVLHQGRLLQVAPPDQVYARPATTFVAQFLGSPGMNLVPGRLRRASPNALRFAEPDGGPPLHLAAQTTEPADHPGGNEERDVLLGFRPEAASLAPPAAPSATPDPALTHFPGRVEDTEPLGNETLVRVRLARGTVVVRSPPAAFPRTDEPVRVTLRPEAIHWFDPATGQRLEDRGSST